MRVTNPVSSPTVLPCLLLGALCLCSGILAAPANAGPNGGGTLIVHDTGSGYTNASSTYPTAPPVDCGSVDAEMPLTVPPGYSGRVWKVYAAFTPGSSPRLKALAFAEAFDPSLVSVLAGGPPSPAGDFEISEFGWPTANGGAVALSFLTVKTDLLSEVYWFGGYAYQGQPGLWTTAPHPTQASVFVDDTVPPVQDPITGFSSIGFGMPGMTICPALEQVCCLPDGSCQLITPSDCMAAGGSFVGGSSCEPNPCEGMEACCLLTGECTLLPHGTCVAQGGHALGPGTTCSPNPCPFLGACCFANGHCQFLLEMECLHSGGSWLGKFILCDPNPCPQPPGACCVAGDHCEFVPEATCLQLGGIWLDFTSTCTPNPCPLLGACCYSDGHCMLRLPDECLPWGWPMGPDTPCDPNPCGDTTVPCCTREGECWLISWRLCDAIMGTPTPEFAPCDPNPCPQPTGTCCYPDGSCVVTLQVDCHTGDWNYWSDCDPNPCPQIGACCHRDGSCEMLLPAQCDLIWFEESCDPNPCPSLEGACCLEGGVCEVRMMADCPGLFDPFHFCVPNPCIPQPGACCLHSGDCQMLTNEECSAQGGVFYGGDCDPLPCAATPVERTTWSRIKQHFHRSETRARD